jgi:TrmH family RNA methyltransferase
VVRVVLVGPQIPANVGFVARVLSNFALTEWCLLGGCGWRGTEAERTGAPAREVLEAVREVDDLTDAVSGCTHVIGFTARSGKHRAVLDLAELPEVAKGWGDDARPVFLFGREDRGLEAPETDACTHLVRIPTLGLPSLNLSHAVAVALYEWFRMPGSSADGPAWSDAGDRRRFVDDVAAELEAVEFPDRGEELEGTLRRLSALPLETRDLRVLDRIVRHARWRRERP